MPIWISFVLLAAGILAIYVELFLPAAGLIGLAGGGMIVAGVVLGYVYHDALTGSIVLVTSLVVTPTAVIVGLKTFPKTPMGKRLILGNSDGTDDGGAAEYRAGTTSGASDEAPGAADPRPEGRPATGDEGEALTVLRPSGTARLNGRKVSVVTSGEYVEQGARLRVARVEGNRIVVREVRKKS
ncbi:MAG: NfeD family protein [Spirochaetales bacterium]